MNYTLTKKAELQANINYNKDNAIIEHNFKDVSQCNQCNFKNDSICLIKDCITNKCNKDYFKNNTMQSIISSNKKSYHYLKEVKAFNFIQYLKNNSEYKLLVQELIKQIKDYCSYSSEYYQLNSTDLAIILNSKLHEYNMKVITDINNNYIVIDNNLNKVYSIAI